jgi:hypothetical protein
LTGGGAPHVLNQRRRRRRAEGSCSASMALGSVSSFYWILQIKNGLVLNQPFVYLYVICSA